MKGIILAGGTGSRLYPLTKVTNKHLLPIGNKPMIYYPIEKLTGVGIDEILIVTGTEHMGDVVTLLGSGKDFGCRFTYKVQDEAGGIAQALGLAENFVGDDSMTVILGDNIFQTSLEEAVNSYPGQGAQILLKEVEDPERFGVAEVDGDKIIGIEEKPDQPKSNLAVTGMYMYDAQVFDYIRTLEPSDRGELEITDVNNHYIQEDKMRFSVMEGWWTDAGTPKSYKRANKLVSSSTA
ncbi:sugar phosphate nucleotidyltransferase [Fodinibius halophilus]|uniref:glucose-1-phosphate thymidylyltransferase n=1 Tax=Fodinibius halophilus TaxID=1736908 RepID=A0A6M1SW96_9BACT|nr:sugar phosphate nucleotidyltransferase [Fodinibius halophilus]NGP87816.1 NTP transferase domain-containing protein [Fodinibius halophilus]